MSAQSARRLLLACSFVVLLGTLFGIGPHAQQPSAADPWGFDDAAKVETWGDILRPQVMDIAATTALIAFALVSFFKKSKTLKYLMLGLALVYFGIYKSQLMSITDIFRVADWDFPEFKRTINWYLFAAFTLVSTIVWGRVYCGRICAFGAFTQLLDATVPKGLRKDPPLWLERRASYIKYGLLTAVLVYYVTVRHTALQASVEPLNVYRYVEPFWMFTWSANTILWLMLGSLLLLTLVVRNAYCRFLCPLGAMLGVISQVTTVFRIKRWSECSTCKICEKACEWGAIEGPKIIRSECVRCDDCERIYDDKKACVHHLMIFKKEKWMKAGIPLTSGSPTRHSMPAV